MQATLKNLDLMSHMDDHEDVSIRQVIIITFTFPSFNAAKRNF